MSANGVGKHAVSLFRVQLNTAIFLKVGQPFVITIKGYVMTADRVNVKVRNLLLERL